MIDRTINFYGIDFTKDVLNTEVTDQFLIAYFLGGGVLDYVTVEHLIANADLSNFSEVEELETLIIWIGEKLGIYDKDGKIAFYEQCIRYFDELWKHTNITTSAEPVVTESEPNANFILTTEPNEYGKMISSSQWYEKDTAFSVIAKAFSELAEADNTRGDDPFNFLAKLLAFETAYPEYLSQVGLTVEDLDALGEITEKLKS
jgi:hypothetical protein